MTNEVTLGWPPKECSPNSRLHWSKRAKAAKAYRRACWILSLEAKLCVDWEGPVHVWLTFYPPDKRHRDMDNILASCKALLDGVADALAINDKKFQLHLAMGDSVAGMVRVRIGQTINGQQAAQPGEDLSQPPTPALSTREQTGATREACYGKG